jgi:hypothetical protein
MPLLDVASGQDRLKLDRIDTDTVLSPEANRYLMVVLNTQSQGNVDRRKRNQRTCAGGPGSDRS